jgi:hypothetical protein
MILNNMVTSYFVIIGEKERGRKWYLNKGKIVCIITIKLLFRINEHACYELEDDPFWMLLYPENWIN